MNSCGRVHERCVDSGSERSLPNVLPFKAVSREFVDNLTGAEHLLSVVHLEVKYSPVAAVQSAQVSSERGLRKGDCVFLLHRSAQSQQMAVPGSKPHLSCSFHAPHPAVEPGRSTMPSFPGPGLSPLLSVSPHLLECALQNVCLAAVPLG